MVKNDLVVDDMGVLSGKAPEVHKNGLEDEINRYKDAEINKIGFSIIWKPSIFSLIALLISFFLDLSSVPILGDISNKIAQSLFPNSQPISEVVPFAFWWLPLVVYAFFILIAFLAFNKLKVEVSKTPASETIDRIINSYQSIIDSVSTALPLIGAALLLISVNLGKEMFQGLSVPFEIKALIILAIGKLFEPVLDQLGLEFQKITSHIEDKKEKYFSRIQIENSRNLVKQITQQQGSLINSNEISLKDLEAYKTTLEHSYQLSTAILKNFTGVHNILQEINKINSFDHASIEKLNILAQSITQASKSLSDEKTISGLKHLEAIVKK